MILAEKNWKAGKWWDKAMTYDALPAPFRYRQVPKVFY